MEVRIGTRYSWSADRRSLNVTQDLYFTMSGHVGKLEEGDQKAKVHKPGDLGMASACEGHLLKNTTDHVIWTQTTCFPVNQIFS